MGAITDGTKYGTAADASLPPSNDSMPVSLSDNFRVTRSAAQPAVFANTGSPLKLQSPITDRLDVLVTKDQIYLWENTPNRYSAGIQIQADTGVAVWMSLSETPLVMQDQATLAANGSLPKPQAHWTQVTLDANGYGTVYGQISGLWFKHTGDGRVTVLSQ
jgi:hypothetical protein